jgi:phospholipid/cholesterol/gamma-HCH transport system ATP-binding protein
VVASLDPAETYLLRQRVGVVPAHGGLVSNLKMWENITLPLLYHSGGITPEEERTALGYLEQLGYTGNVMAMPAHLSARDRRSATLVRTLLSRPEIILYSNFIDAASPEERSIFIRIAGEFQAASTGRTSVYLSSSPELSAELQVDLVIRVRESDQHVSRPV